MEAAKKSAGVAQDQANDTASDAVAEPHDAEPVGEGEYVVKKGDCISSIALATGHFWETIWNDPANTELRETRKNPNVLLPGDRITIPEMQPKTESGVTEARHRFVRLGSPEILQIRFEHAKDEPYTDEPYTIAIDDESRDGCTDADGFLREIIPPDAQVAIVRFDQFDEEYNFGLGHLEPIDTIKGVQERLANLGFLRGGCHGKLDLRTTTAIRRYQEAHAMETRTGELDDATRQHILETHKS
jgi:hypothetical protein